MITKNEFCIGFDRIGEVEVSTVDLLIDIIFVREDAPIRFETAVFGADGSLLATRRCTTRDEAVQQHREVLADWQKKLGHEPAPNQD